MSDLQLSETIKQKPEYKIKSYTMVVVLVTIIIGFLITIGRFGPDFFAIIIFFVIMLIPVVLLLRNKLVNVLPKIISDNLLEIDHSKEKKNLVKFNPSRYTKQLGMYIMIVILLVGSIFFLKKSMSGLKDNKIGKKIIYKILGSLICTVISGIILLEIDYV